MKKNETQSKYAKAGAQKWFWPWLVFCFVFLFILAGFLYPPFVQRGYTPYSTAPFFAEVWSGVNINEAPAEELEALPGVGPVKAAAIIEYRTAHGYFKSAADLLNVPGIGEKTLEGMKKYVSF